MALNRIISRNDLNILGKLAVQETRRELVFQKHVASAALYDSVEYKITSINYGLRLGVYALPYSIFVDSGRRAGGKRVPISALMEWVKIKGFETDDKAAKSMAFAIQEKIFQDGIPTSRSKRIASRRTKFIQIVKENIESEAREIVTDKVQDNVRSQLNKWFREAQKDVNNG